MTDFVVTNGVVEYSRTIRPADFESKVAKATLSFNIAEGADPAVVLAKVSAIAKEQVHAELGLAHNRGLKPEDRPAAVEVEKPKRVRVVNAAEVEPSNPKKAIENPLEQMAAENAQPQEPASIEAVSDEDLLADLAGGKPKEISDEDLKVQCMKVSAHLRKTSPDIGDLRKAIAACGGDGYTSIPQDRRQEFMDKTNALLKR